MTENLPTLSPAQALTDEELTALTEPAPEANKGIAIADIVHLRNKGLTLKQIGTILDTTKQNIHQRLAVINADIDTTKNFSSHKADVLAVIQHQLLNALTPDEIKKIPGIQKILGFGILYDKEIIEREKHETGNDISDMHMSLEEIERKLEALESGSEPEDITA